MRLRQAKLAALVLGCFCTVGLGASYTWSGDGDGTTWTDNDNWDFMGFCTTNCYPNSCSDDATIPSSGGGAWTVEIITEAIDDLAISGDVDFVDGETDPTLTVDSLTINGGVTVTITDATIVASSCS